MVRGWVGLSVGPFAQGGLDEALGLAVCLGRAVLIGTPLGILAGTYMAEYGRYTKLTLVVRFIIDILLSAPSIVVGLFVYEAMVARMGHFSGWAGAVSLAVIVVPVVVRTTEDMLLLVPNQLREAAFALGMPRSLVIRRVAYRAARAGMITGVLPRSPASAARPRPCCSPRSTISSWSLDLNAPMASLPVVIFQFALSPYKDWQQLAWTGALIITFAVLALTSRRARLPGQGFRNDAGHHSDRPASDSPPSPHWAEFLSTAVVRRRISSRTSALSSSVPYPRHSVTSWTASDKAAPPRVCHPALTDWSDPCRPMRQPLCPRGRASRR